MVFSDFNLLQAYALRSLEVCQLHERLSSLEEEIALGKKNWLFFGTKDCGKIHALFYIPFTNEF